MKPGLVLGIAPSGRFTRCAPLFEDCVANGAGRSAPVILRVVRITRTVTHSRRIALLAYLHYSEAGLCDLALADPVLYNLGTGTVSGVPKAVCDKQPKSVPFTPLVTTP